MKWLFFTLVILIALGFVWVVINDKCKPFAEKIRKGCSKVVEWVKSLFKK
jgi:hypothetical protein